MPASVLTLTLNPALDRFCATPRVQPQHKLRCSAPIEHPGGGGINVARVLHRLGAAVEALYAAGGPTGVRLQTLLAAEGLSQIALPVDGDTRENLSVRETSSGEDYRFLLPGPPLSETGWACIRDAVTQRLPGLRLLVLSGSLPPGAPADAWGQLARLAQAQGVAVALDASGPALRAGLEAGVEIVKPSRRELEELSGARLASPAAEREAAAALVNAGRARWVALSLGADGALLVNRDGAWRAPALAVTVASTIGAGDSLLAGLLQGWLQGQTPADCLRLGVAAGAAALQQAGTALAQAEAVHRLSDSVRVTNAA